MPDPVTQTDTDDLFDWQTITTQYYEDGSIAAIETVYDNQTYVFERFFLDGSSTIVTDDLGDLYSWGSKTNTFNNAGELDGLTGFDFDNGTMTRDIYVDGEISSAARIDDPAGDGQHSWTRIDTVYDIASKIEYNLDFDVIAFRATEFDDGVYQEDSYSFGRLEVSTKIDNSADGSARNWVSDTLTYDTTFGGLVSRLTKFDDGVEKGTTYVDGVIFETVQSDTQDTRNWDQIKTMYNDGDLFARETVFDDGIHKLERDFFNGGTADVIRLNDANNVRNWDVIEKFGLSSDTQTILTVYDNDIHQVETIQNGARISLTKQDAGDIYTWDTTATYYDQSGQITAKIREEDSGLQTVTFFENGARTRIESRDTQDIVSWDQRETYFDQNGDRAAFVTQFDNGIERVELYTDGQRSSIEERDTQDVKSWDSIDTYYDLNGDRVARVTSADDGVVKTELFDQGLRTQTTQEDQSNIRTFDTIDTYFENGVQVAKVTDYDDGVRKEELFDQGNRTQITQTDQDDIKSWDSIETFFDISGQILGKVSTFDAGITRTDFYADGKRIVTSQEDVADVFEWNTIESSYDENETLETRLTRFDDTDRLGTLWSDGSIQLSVDFDGADDDAWYIRATDYRGAGPVTTDYQLGDTIPDEVMDLTGLAFV